MARTEFFESKRKDLPLPILFRFSTAAETKLQLTPHQHLVNMRDGTATQLSWEMLKYRVNVGVLLAAEQHQDNVDLCDALTEAVLAISSIGRRFARLGRFGCSGDESRAIGRGLDLVDELQKTSTRKQQRKASQIAKDLSRGRAPQPGGAA